MLVMTPAAQSGVYQTIKTEIASMVKTYLEANPIADMSALIAYIQSNIPGIAGVPKGFQMSPHDILRHIQEFNQMQAVDGNNCTEQTVNGETVMASNGDPIVLI